MCVWDIPQRFSYFSGWALYYPNNIKLINLCKNTQYYVGDYLL